MSLSQHTADHEVTAPVLDFLARATGVDGLAPEQDYIAEGLIDSMLALELVAWVEQRFGIQVEVVDLDLDNFRTAARIAGFVRRKRSGPGDRDG